MTYARVGNAISKEHQVLTLETRKLSWRMIELRHTTTLVNYNGKLASIRESVFLHCVGVTDSNEVVLENHSLDGPFNVFYYCLESETIRRVEIQGLGAFGGFRVYTFVDHVEDVKLLKGVLGL
ncbi:unnamed protein product [Brassica napus]|uniref:(rape) hypothetical protein n=1 Tax=Brassica napus TaxID=3708 RepID=A0A816JKK6_BRANA|nr:unnamed protein product [Brassica napus]